MNYRSILLSGTSLLVVSLLTIPASTLPARADCTVATGPGSLEDPTGGDTITCSPGTPYTGDGIGSADRLLGTPRADNITVDVLLGSEINKTDPNNDAVYLGSFAKILVEGDIISSGKSAINVGDFAELDVSGDIVSSGKEAIVANDNLSLLLHEGGRIESTSGTEALRTGANASVVIGGSLVTNGNNALYFNGAGGRLTLLPTFSIVGAVTSSATYSLALGGAGPQTFDASLIGPVNQFQNVSELIKEGASVWTLTGTSDFTGPISISEGQLLVNGSIGLSSLTTVNSGSTLGGTGTVGNTTIASGGFLAPGNSIGTLAVAGNLLLSPGSIYNVEIEASGATDRVDVSGSATITDALVSVAMLDPATSYQNGQSYRILGASGGVTGEFVPIISQSAFLDFNLDYGANSVDLIVALKPVPEPEPEPEPEPRPVFGTVAVTPNQLATAGALDGLQQSGPQLALYNALLMLSADQARGAFDQLSGEMHASSQTALIEAASHIRNAANNRIRSAFGATGAAPMLVMPYGDDGLDKMPGSVPVIDDRGAAWGSVFGSWGSTNSNANAAELDRSTGGAVAGIDGMLDTWRVGALAGYSRSSFDLDDRSSSGDADNYHVGLYGGTQWGAFGFRTGLAYTWSDIDTQRSVFFPGFADTLSASYDAGTFQAFGELGYAIETEAARLEPFFNLAHVSVRTDGFAETGGAAALTTARSTTDTTFTTLGVRATTDLMLGEAQATARGAIGWQHAFGDTTPLSTNAFAGGSAFSIAGAPIARNAAVVELGLDFAITPHATLGISYDGKFGSGTQDHGGRVGLNVRF